MREDFIDDYQLFLDQWGLEAQERMAIEEMSELTKELCKHIRYTKDDFNESYSKEKKEKNIENIKEEIADVINMAEQLQHFFGIEEIEKIREEKMKRTKNEVKK